jgi:hypothetical protein
MVPPKQMMKTYSACSEKFHEKAEEGASYCVKAGKMDLESLNQCIGWMEALSWVRGIEPSPIQSIVENVEE